MKLSNSKKKYFNRSLPKMNFFPCVLSCLFVRIGNFAELKK